MLEEEQVKVVGEERVMCIWLFLAPGSPALCCLELFGLGRLTGPLEALVFLPFLPWVASPNSEFACLSGGKARPLAGPDQPEPQDRVGSIDLPVALAPCSCFGPRLSALRFRQKVELHQLLLLPRPQGMLWVSSRAVFIPSTSASEPVTLSARL